MLCADNPLLLQSRAQVEQAPLLFPPFNVPKPAPLTQTDKELMERSRFLSETLKYSGYYVIPSPHSTKLLQAHALNGSSSGVDSSGGGGAQIYTPVFERYSDRYRKILGKKNFYNEIPHPNPHLFPPELLSSKHQIHSTSTFTSKVQFLSSRNLEKEVARLVAAGAALRTNIVGEERQRAAAGAGGVGVGGSAEDDESAEAALEKKDAEAEDAEEEPAEEEAESDDMEEGGDYVDNYGDDDEDGGGDPLDDNGDEGETM